MIWHLWKKIDTCVYWIGLLRVGGFAMNMDENLYFKLDGWNNA
jgi:hypothetical protein